jgi:hypothetical protein
VFALAGCEKAGEPRTAGVARASLVEVELAEHPSLRPPVAMSLATAIATESALLSLEKKLRQIARAVHSPS